MERKKVKVVVFVPETHADQIRQALSDSGAGVIGNYHHCSFSTKGTGRYVPGDQAKPHIGQVGQSSSVGEERIETPCNLEDLPKIIEAVKSVHPYEEPVIEVYQLFNWLVST